MTQNRPFHFKYQGQCHSPAFSEEVASIEIQSYRVFIKTSVLTKSLKMYSSQC